VTDHSHGSTSRTFVTCSLRSGCPWNSATIRDTGVWVTYHYGFSADIGGGEYPRPEVPDTPFRVGSDQPYARITDALQAWPDTADAPSPAVIELAGSTAYQEQLDAVSVAPVCRSPIRLRHAPLVSCTYFVCETER